MSFSGGLLALITLAWNGTTAGAADDPPDFAAYAARYLEGRGFMELSEDTAALDQVLERDFVTLDLGLFDVRYPRNELGEAKRADELKQLVLALIDLQRSWRSWLDGTPPATRRKGEPEETDEVRAWVISWKADALRRCSDPDASGVLASALGADTTSANALRAFADVMRTGAAAGQSLVRPTRLVLSPTRAEFVGFSAFVGSLDERWKQLLWTPVLPLRVEFHVDDLLCLALEHPAAEGTTNGRSMNEQGKSGQLEHVTQYAAERLIRSLFGGALDPGVASGITVNLVIEIFGQNNSHVSGSSEGRSTPPRERFVRGGRDGGKLPKVSADSRWRRDLGKDWFVGVLRASQKDASKRAEAEDLSRSGPTAHFLIDSKTQGDQELVSAPFLGAAAVAKEVPQDCLADYQEFLRAYRSAFVQWLMTEIESKDDLKPSQEFAGLLCSCLDGTAVSFDDRVVTAYGVPLTSPEPSEALEWQFLIWLSRTK